MPDDLDGNRIESNHYVADVLRGNGAEPFWYYVLQRKGSSEIIDLVKFANYEDAVRAARLAISRMHRVAGRMMPDG